MLGLLLVSGVIGVPLVFVIGCLLKIIMHLDDVT